MARRKKGNPVNGWLVLDKPAGRTSNAALSQVKRLFNPQKAGFAGTLDPLASGVLPIAFGEATKTIPYVVDACKVYRFRLRWGEERDTDDSEGAVLHRADRRPSPTAVEDAAAEFTGTIEQTPPAFSAVKVEGERAYKKARAGEEVTLEPRRVTVHSLIFHAEAADTDEDHAVFTIECGKGFYVRAFARDLGRKLGCYAHIEALRREKVGPFNLQAAISLDKLEQFSHSPPPSDLLLGVDAALDDIPALAVTSGEADRLRAGQSVRVPFRESGTVRVLADDRLVALAENNEGEVKPFRVFNLT